MSSHAVPLPQPVLQTSFDNRFASCIAADDAILIEDIRFQLSGTVAVSFDWQAETREGFVIRLAVEVEFPDEARSFLQSISWRDGARMTDTLCEIASAYVKHVTAGLADANELAGELRLTAPLEFFREQLLDHVLR